MKASAEVGLDLYSREQLLKIVDHFGERCLKDNMKAILNANLFEDGIFKGMGHSNGCSETLLVCPCRAGLSSSSCSGGFAQSKELLLLQLEQSKLQPQTEREKLTFEKLKQATVEKAQV